MRHMRVIGFAVTILLMYNVLSIAQEELNHNYKVKLVITADEDIKGLVESFLGRELRSLGDVTVTDNDPGWVMNIVAIKMKTNQNSILGYALSTVITCPIEKTIAWEACELDKMGIMNKFVYVTSWVHYCNMDDIHNICSLIVTGFDIDCINTLRKINKHIKIN